MGYVNKIQIDSNTAHLVEPTLYGTCSTAAATAIKDVTLDSFTLITGVQVAVKFTVTNTAAVANLKLRVNSNNADDAKPIKYRGANLSDKGILANNRIYLFVYDGTNWELVGDIANSNTLQRTFRSSSDVELPIAGINASNSATATYNTSSSISSGSYEGMYAAIPNTVANLATINPSTGKITVPGGIVANITGNVSGTAGSLSNSFILKIDTGTEEGTDLYTYNGGTEKILDIVPGENITLTTTSGQLSIAATDTTYSDFSPSGVGHAAGLVPDPGSTAGTTKFLCEDGEWKLVPVPDVNVTQNILEISNSNYYPILVSNYEQGTNTTTATVTNRVQAIYVQPSTGTISATLFDGSGASLTNLNATNINSGILDLDYLEKGSANTALMGNGNSDSPSYVSVAPSITITDGDGSNAPKFNVTVLGVSGTTAAEITTASTSVYGATKLSAIADDATLAATAKSVYDLKEYVDALLATADALVFKGVISSNNDIPTTGYSAGWTYKVGTAGTYVGEVCEVGDLVIAVSDPTEEQNSRVNSHWAVIQNNVDGAVFKGANTFSDEHIIIADGTEGKVKDTPFEINFTLNNSNAMTAGSIYPTVTNIATLGKDDKVWNNVYATTFTGALVGNADTATQVYITAAAPSSGTAYYLTHTTSTTSGNQNLYNKSTVYAYLGGTKDYLVIGNSSKAGGFTIFNTKYTDIIRAANDSGDSSNHTLTLPSTDGWIAVGGSASGTTTGVGNDLYPIYLNTSGQLVTSTSHFADGGANSQQLMGYTVTTAATKHENVASYASHILTMMNCDDGLFLWDNTDSTTVWSWRKQTVNGNSVWKADAATTDASGNTITTYYCTLSTAQTLSGNKTFSGRVILTKNTDASGTAANAVALVVGGAQTDQHIEIDNNEILSKSDGTTPSTLYLQDSTGTVSVAGSGGLAVTATTTSSSKTTGALRVSGGVGVSGSVYASNFNGLTLTAATTGFTIAGGTTSKTLTVNQNCTLNGGSSSYLAYYSAANSISGHGLAHFNDTYSSSSANGKNELVLGNSTGKATNGSAWGQLALYSEGTKGTYLKSAENSTAWYTLTMPAKDGTICLTDGTGASGTWGININGSVWKRTALTKGTNPSSTNWQGLFYNYQTGSGTATSDRIGGCIESYVDANGLTALCLRAYKYASGSSDTNSIEIRCAKDGTCTYTVSNAANFRSAISAPSTTGSDASGTWGISITGNAATTTKLAHTTLNSTTINNTAGSFAFSGSGDPWSGTDWVGLQIGDSADKFQISANGNTLVFRQNDSGGTNTSWSDWVTMLTSSNYSTYTVTKTGSGASGTWGINITGSSASVSYQNNNLDFSQTNFGISSNVERNLCWLGDKNGSGLVRLDTLAKTDGTIQGMFQVRRWNTSGSAIGGFVGITLTGNRSNGVTCTIDGATTISGNITSTGILTLKHSTIDLKQSNNGLSSNADRYMQVSDKNGYNFALFQGVARTDGSVYLYIGVNNRKTDGTALGWGGISISQTKSSADVTYSVSNAANFRSAISAPSTTGGSASGTWGISITGNSRGIGYTIPTATWDPTKSSSAGSYNNDWIWIGSETNGAGIFRVRTEAGTDGKVTGRMQVRTYKDSSSAWGGYYGINFTAARNSTVTCTIDGTTYVSGHINAVGYMETTHGSIDITSASNNLSSNTGYAFYGADKNGKDFTRVLSYALTGGETRLYLQVRNHTGSAYTSYGGIIMKANKSNNNIDYEVTNNANFRTAIGVGASGTHADTYFVQRTGDAMSGTLAIVNNTQNNATYNALLYIEHKSGNDWGAIINKNSASDYGMQILCTSTGSHGLDVTGRITGTKVYGAVWNDYAEYRQGDIIEGGYCVTESANGVMHKSTKRLQPGCRVTSDTFGFAIGETEKCKTPIAVCGRVLVYPYRNPIHYQLGAPVCSAPGGTVDIMSRDEVMMYPERIVGTVSEIPDYDVWECGEGKDDTLNHRPVNGRIWIYVR